MTDNTVIGMGKGKEELGVVVKSGEKSSDFGVCGKRNASEVEPSDEKMVKRSKIVKALRDAGVVGKYVCLNQGFVILRLTVARKRVS